MSTELRLAGCLLLVVGSLVVSTGCGDDETGPGTDGGRMDAGDRPDGAPPPVDSGGVDGGVEFDTGVCSPTIEICGDFIDQDCDGRDTGCGDSDMDGIEACREGDDLTMCDCDDGRADVRPPFGTVAGAPELCDGVDNDCNGRVDEAAECCAGCVGVDPSRADICDTSGTCVCTTGSGTGPCAEGQTCCSGGCVDTGSDFDNCGSCNAMCTPSSDNCSAGLCRCGTMAGACDFVTECNSGSCG